MILLSDRAVVEEEDNLENVCGMFVAVKWICMNNPGVKNSWEISTCTEQFLIKRFTATA